MHRWDTVNPNDGGSVFDAEVRGFIEKHRTVLFRISPGDCVTHVVSNPSTFGPLGLIYVCVVVCWFFFWFAKRWADASGP
jgi:hypothetical protein